MKGSNFCKQRVVKSQKPIFRGVFLFLVFLCSQSIQAQEQSELINSVFNKVVRIEEFSEALAEAMGKDFSHISPITAVENIDVVTLEVMGAGLFEKINKLRFQLLRTKYVFDKAAYMQAIHDRKGLGDLQSLNVLLDRVTANAGDITAYYQITVRENVKEDGVGLDNNIVLMKMLSVTRNINALLETPYRPADVYAEVSASLLILSNEVGNLGYKIDVSSQDTPYEPNKRPRDVYLILMKTYDLINDMLGNKEQGVQRIVYDASVDTVLPGDVYDLSVITYARLSQLIGINGNPPRALAYAYPGVKFPSDVYQRVRGLYDSLSRYRRYLQAHGEQR